MMAQLVDHFLTGLTLADGEHCTLRRKQEHRLTQLLAELVDTERKYVDDLETVRVKTFEHLLSQSTTSSPFPPFDLILGGQRSISDIQERCNRCYHVVISARNSPTKSVSVSNSCKLVDRLPLSRCQL